MGDVAVLWGEGAWGGPQTVPPPSAGWGLRGVWEGEGGLYLGSLMAGVDGVDVEEEGLDLAAWGGTHTHTPPFGANPRPPHYHRRIGSGGRGKGDPPSRNEPPRNGVTNPPPL